MKLLPPWWRANFLLAEGALAVLVAAAFWLFGGYVDGNSTVWRVLEGNRGAVYGTLASIFGSLLGFAITAVSIVIGFANHERLAVVRESRHYPTIWKVFFSAIRTLGLATAMALAGLVIDRDRSPHISIFYLTTFASLLAILRIVRCAWVLENIVDLLSDSPRNP
jgi:hypothetical protein